MKQTFLRIFNRVLLIALVHIICLGAVSSLASERELAFLITYGTDAGTVEGDDDFLQVIFIRTPEDMSDKLYVRIFDADCGGKWDEQFKWKWDTRTRFRLFGGKGAYSTPGIKKPTPAKPALFSGILIADEEFGEDPLRDDKWHTFAVVNPEDGEKIGKFRYFKLVVEGKNGNDGNTFLVTATRDPLSNNIPPEVEIFTHAPTIRLPRTGVFSEMRFFVPKDVHEITVHNFDLSSAKIGVDTAFRSNIKVSSSGQGEWAKGNVRLEENEVGRICAIRFEGGREMPNDGTLYVADNQGNLLPIQLTIYLQKPNLRPDPRIDIRQLEGCNSFIIDGSRTVDREGDVLSFFWNFGDGTTGQGAQVTHRYESPGQYLASVIIKDDSGQIFNSLIERFTVTVNYPPTADAGPDLVAAPGEKLNFDGSGSMDQDGKVVRYDWSFGDDYKARGATVAHVFKKPGLYTATLRVEDDSGTPCNFAMDQRKVFINASPTADIGKDRIASVYEPIVFSSGGSSDSDGEIIAYEWNLGDWSRKSGVDVTHAYKEPGIYKVTLKVTDDAGVNNSNASDTLQVFVNDPPVADAGRDHKGSAGEVIVFDASKSLDRDGGLIEFKWDFGDGTQQKVTDHGKMVSHTYGRPGKYEATLTVTDNSGSSSATNQDKAIVIINSPPIAKAGPDQLGTTGEVQFNATGSLDPDGAIIKYVWDFGDGESATGPSPDHVYQNPGTYTVRLTVIDDSGTSTNSISDEMTVTVNHFPIADAGQDRVGEPEQMFIFDGSASIDPDGKITEYIWDLGDGTIQTGSKVSHKYVKPGTYNALLTVHDNSGHEDAVGFDEASIVINHPPVAIAGSDLVVAPNEKIHFDGSRSNDLDGKITSFHWDFSDGKASSNSAEVRRIFSTPGAYTATLTVVDNHRAGNSTAQNKISVRVNHRPEANCGKDILTAKRTVLLDGSASTDADGDPLTYIWDFGDGTPIQKGEKASHTYAKGGKYPVILTVDDGTGLNNSRSNSSIAVKINEAPIAVAGKNQTVCAGKPVIFDGSGSTDPEGGLMKYKWDFGDGSTAEGVNPVKAYTTGGVYMVTLTVMDDSGLKEGSTSTDQIVITVAESPVADAGSDQTICAGTPVQFNGTGSRDVDGLVNNFRWDFGDGTQGGGPTPTHTYTRAGTYRTNLTITGDLIGNCNNTDTDEMTVTVFEAPVAEFTCPIIAEIGKPVRLEAKQSTGGTAQIIEYKWDFGDGTHGKGETIEHAFAKSGNHIIKLTVVTDTATDCNKTSRQKQVTINESPIAKANSNGVLRRKMKDRLVGVNQVVTFNGALSRDPDGIISSYTWDFGDSQTGTGVQVRHQYKNAGRYTVALQVFDNTDLSNNSDTDTLDITVNEAPKPVISGGGVVCAGDKVSLSGKGSFDPDGKIVKYTWNFGDGSPDRSGMDVNHTYGSPGGYTVILNVDDGGSVNNSLAQTSTSVIVNEPPVVEDGLDQIVSTGEKVMFDGSTAKDRDGAIESYQWDFGDGSHAKGMRVSHGFKAPGKYMVRLVVTDNSGTKCDSAAGVATIRVNAPPVGVIKGELETFFGKAHIPVFFDATGSYDPDGDPLSFYWDFGDGKRAKGPKVSHSFEKPGLYTVKLRVDDGTGLKSGVRWSEVLVQVR